MVAYAWERVKVYSQSLLGYCPLCDAEYWSWTSHCLECHETISMVRDEQCACERTNNPDEAK